MGLPPAGVIRASVLDDDPGMRRFVCRALARHGIVARGFSDSAALFAGLAAERSDALVLDLALGRSDAIEVIRELDGIRYRGKVLLISGRDAVTLGEAHRIGIAHGLAMVQPLPKPFLAADLLERLAQDPSPAEVRAEAVSMPGALVDLARALDNGWVTLWYQPKFTIRTGRLSGAEALIRLQDPQRGTMLPAMFLPPVGDPLHTPVAEFVLARVISDWRTFARHDRPLKLAVNMPVSIIARREFVTFVRRILPSDSTFPGLIVEVTEDEVVADPVLIKEIATQLKLYNVSLSIDDVGTAHSALSRFLDLPFIEAKIDQRFVIGCATDIAKRALCKTMIELAHSFDAVACAEGIESATDLGALADLGCDDAQGFYLGRPMPPEAFVELIGAVGQAETRARVRTG